MFFFILPYIAPLLGLKNSSLSRGLRYIEVRYIEVPLYTFSLKSIFAGIRIFQQLNLLLVRRFDPIYFWCVAASKRLSFCVVKPARLCSICRADWSLFLWRFSIKSEDYFRELWFLETNYIGWWCGLWPIILIKPNWKFKVLINGCDTCFDDILDKMKELQELQKIMIYDLLLVNS